MDKEQNILSGLTILSLEDSERDFELIHDHLILAGFKVKMSRVDTEKEYLFQLNNNTFDLILADYHLPGYDAFEALAQRNKKCPQVPFICVSGSIGEDMAIELLKKGAVDYVLKHKLERLPLTIKRALEEFKQKKEKELAEEALRKSEERLRDIIFSTADWVWEINEQGKYTYSSIKGNQLFDVSEEDIIGKTPFHFMEPAEAERIEKIFAELIINKAPIRNLENWNIAKNGKRICLLTNGVPIFDKDGNFKGYRGVDINITERKLAEEVIKQSEAELNYAQKIAKMGSWKLNYVSNKYSWSQNMYPILGYDILNKVVTREDFIDKVHPEDKYLFDLNRKSIIETGGGADFDFRYLFPNGEIKWMKSISTPYFENDKLIELRGVAIDITDKKLAEQELLNAKEKAEASDRLKTAFLNNISHEIRTPLNGILGFAPFVMDQSIAQEEKAKFLDILNFSSKRLMQTITDYMDASLLTSGNMEIRKSVFSPAELFNEVLKDFQVRCNAKGLLCEIEKPEYLNHIFIESDSELLKKIFSHLLDNALKFTKQGSIMIKLTAKDNFFEIGIKDTGVGIKDDALDAVFKHFVQEETSNTRGHEGSGLGLSIVKGMVELLNGTIQTESGKGIGSTFTVTVPGNITEATNYAEPENNFIGNRISNTVILIAEDDEDSYLYIEYLLNKPYRLIRAEDGQQAIDLCLSKPEINLVLMDIKMPGINGLVATQRIKEFRKDLPIIALTSYAETGMREKCLDAGCDDYISKPLEKSRLYSTLSKFGFDKTGN